MELPTSSCHQVLHPRYYGLVGNFSRKSPGTLLGGYRRSSTTEPYGMEGTSLGRYASNRYRMFNSHPLEPEVSQHTHCRGLPPPLPQSMSLPPSHWVVIAVVVKPAVNHFSQEAAATLITPSLSLTIGPCCPLPSKSSPIHLSLLFVDCCVKLPLQLLRFKPRSVRLPYSTIHGNHGLHINPSTLL